MIVLYFFLGAFIVVGGVLYFVTNYVYTEALTLLETSFPAHYSGAGPDLLTALVYWSLLFMVIITAVIYARVQSEKPGAVIR